MKTVLSSRRHRYLARVGIFLIVVALVLGIAGCGGGGVKYDLTISSTAGGSVFNPGEAGPYTYDEGEVVNLVAEAEEGYRFVKWTGYVVTIADVEDATTTITMNGDYSITAKFEGVEITFADSNLEAAVRETISIPEGPIYAPDMKQLSGFNAPQSGISDLTGLEYATRLASLNLNDNQISDIKPLANLTNLTMLYLADNQISDISALADLTNLYFLYLDDNQISDISPLANLTEIFGLFLSDNQITDIKPLVDNEGLCSSVPAIENIVTLTGNPLSSDSINIYIPQLEARGVTVDY
jgi:hypothetical protein